MCFLWLKFTTFCTCIWFSTGLLLVANVIQLCCVWTKAAKYVYHFSRFRLSEDSLLVQQRDNFLFCPHSRMLVIWQGWLLYDFFYYSSFRPFVMTFVAEFGHPNGALYRTGSVREQSVREPTVDVTAKRLCYGLQQTPPSARRAYRWRWITHPLSLQVWRLSGLVSLRRGALIH